nr:hypothetical protein [Lachnospiraceae bacterium]
LPHINTSSVSVGIMEFFSNKYPNSNEFLGYFSKKNYICPKTAFHAPKQLFPEGKLGILKFYLIYAHQGILPLQ